MKRPSIHFTDLKHTVLLMLYHERRRNKNSNHHTSSLVDIRGLEKQQMFELNFNIKTGLFDSKVNRKSRKKLAKYVQKRQSSQKS